MRVDIGVLRSKRLFSILSLKWHLWPRADESKYQTISESLQDNFHERGDSTVRAHWVSWTWKGIVCLLALWGCFDLLHRSWRIIQSERRVSCNCGNSTAEAMALGCKFELLAGAWLPDACRDDELAEEFNHAGPGPNGEWGYYDHRNGSKELTVAEVAAYADRPSERYWTSFDWHLAHCIFYWRKQYRSRFNGLKVDSRHNTEGHIIHCGKMFFKQRPEGGGSEIVTHNGVALNLDMTEVEEAKYRGLPLTPIKPGN